MAMGLSKNPVVPFLVVIFIHSFSISLIVPGLPNLVLKVFHGDYSRSSYFTGALSTLQACLEFVANPLFGALSDKYGRKPFLLYSLSGAVLQYALLALDPELAVLVISHIVAGVSAITFTIIYAALVDLSSGGDTYTLSRNFGLLGAAFGAGFVLGPVVGGSVGLLVPSLPFFLACIFDTANCLVAWKYIPETVDLKPDIEFTWSAANPMKPLALFLRSPGLCILAVSIFLTGLSRGVYTVMFLYASYRYDWTIMQLGIFLTVVGVFLILWQGALLPHIVRRFGEVKAVIVGLSMDALHMVGNGLATHGWHLYLILVLFSVEFIAHPALRGLTSKNVPKSMQGALQGALGSLATGSRIFGPMLASETFGFFISDDAPFHCPGAPFFLASYFVFLAAVLIAISKKRFLDTMSGQVEEDVPYRAKEAKQSDEWTDDETAALVRP